MRRESPKSPCKSSSGGSSSFAAAARFAESQAAKDSEARWMWGQDAGVLCRWPRQLTRPHHRPPGYQTARWFPGPFLNCGVAGTSSVVTGHGDFPLSTSPACGSALPREHTLSTTQPRRRPSSLCVSHTGTSGLTLAPANKHGARVPKSLAASLPRQGLRCAGIASPVA